jgi:multidrug efflux pump subunit AcrA (membrane-fusion protein)
MADDSSSETPKSAGLGVTLIVCALLVLAAAGGGWWIYHTQPEAERSTRTRETAMLVEVVEAERGDFRPRISVLGTTEAAREIRLGPRVRGQVVARSPDFTPGGFLDEGEWMVEIDPADFRNALRQRESELLQARADLELEMGRQKIAESDLELLDELGEPGARTNRDLVLRQPQLRTAEARVASAEAAVEQAKLDLQRTSIKAPFKLQVIERLIDVGSQVAPGDDLGRLVGIEEFWVITTVPLAALPRIEFAARGEGAGSPVNVRNRSAWVCSHAASVPA